MPVTDPSVDSPLPYAGRFAPSPTGPLHIGSLIAAVASRADALAGGGRWLLRIDDIDPPREWPGARSAIPRTLERFGLFWNGPIRYQSARLERYAEALSHLATTEHLYRCRCSRRTLAGLSRYPGTCRAERVRAGEPVAPSPRPKPVPGEALRLELDGRVRIVDAVQGRLDVDLAEGPGDVVLRRRDGLIGYPLASAVDDADVARVVRGADLLDTSAVQLAILERLGAASPGWAHVPIAVDAQGRKLGKSTGAPPVDTLEPLPTLCAVWTFLGQRPLGASSLERFWDAAPTAWSLSSVPRARARTAPEGSD